MKKIYILLLVSLLLSVFFSPLSSSDETAPESLKAYRAVHIPAIDGIKSLGEWDDTEAYFSEQAVPPDITLARDNAIMSLYLKHDTKNLYILFTINDDDYSCNDSLVLYWQQDYTSGIVIFGDGSVYYSQLTGYGVQISNRTPLESKLVGAGVSYKQGNYTFEISININQFFEPNYKNQISCVIIYEDANYTGYPFGGLLGRLYSVGFSDSITTISLLSEPYYSSYFSPFDIWIMGIVIIVVLIGLIGLMLKTKKGGK